MVLDRDFYNFIGVLESYLPNHKLAKWKSGKRYRFRFCKAFLDIATVFRPMVSACSFRTKTMRAAREGILAAYNSHLGGAEGLGIGFSRYRDHKGRLQLKHSFVSGYSGYHEIECPENQMLVLLLMAWLAADQYYFYFNQVVNRTRRFQDLRLTVVSDKLSGDDDFRRKSEENLRKLIDPNDFCRPIALTRSRLSDTHPGDLLADNLAGWLNGAVTEPSGELAYYASQTRWNGWYELMPSTSGIHLKPASSRLENNLRKRK